MKKAKGTKKYIVKREITFKSYADALFNDEVIIRSQQGFKYDHHKVCTEEVNKIALSSNDDKRIQIFDKVTTFPYEINSFKVCEGEMLSKNKLNEFDEDIDKTMIENIDSTMIEDIDNTMIEDIDNTMIEDIDNVMIEDIDNTMIEDIDNTMIEDIDIDNTSTEDKDIDNTSTEDKDNTSTGDKDNTIPKTKTKTKDVRNKLIQIFRVSKLWSKIKKKIIIGKVVIGKKDRSFGSFGDMVIYQNYVKIGYIMMVAMHTQGLKSFVHVLMRCFLLENIRQLHQKINQTLT